MRRAGAGARASQDCVDTCQNCEGCVSTVASGFVQPIFNQWNGTSLAPLIPEASPLNLHRNPSLCQARTRARLRLHTGPFTQALTKRTAVPGAQALCM